MALITALLLTGPALSAVRIGTSGNETLVGTSKSDLLNGRGGDDQLKGKAGNDVYFFANDWGNDTLIETANGGTDTVNFHAVTNGPVNVSLIPEWASFCACYNMVSGVGSQSVIFVYTVNDNTVQSVVENAIGGQGNNDFISGGGGTNVLQPGGGARDTLGDSGGSNGGSGTGLPPIPASNDIYKGFTSNTEMDVVEDWGGSGDQLDLRPFATGDVYIDAIDLDKNGTEESLQIVTSSTTQVVVAGQFGDWLGLQESENFHGQIETIRFADTTFKTTSALRNLATASAEAMSGKQAKLAAAAAGLAKEARTSVDPNDPLGLHGMRGE